MIRRPLQRNARRHQPPQRIRQLRTVRIKNRHVIHPRPLHRRRTRPFRMPRVQPDVMVIIFRSPRRQERRRISQPLRNRESQHVMIKPQRPIQVRHLQMNMPNPRLRMNLFCHGQSPFPSFYPPPLCSALPPSLRHHSPIHLPKHLQHHHHILLWLLAKLPHPSTQSHQVPRYYKPIPQRRHVPSPHIAPGLPGSSGKTIARMTLTKLKLLLAS